MHCKEAELSVIDSMPQTMVDYPIAGIENGAAMQQMAESVEQLDRLRRQLELLQSLSREFESSYNAQFEIQQNLGQLHGDVVQCIASLGAQTALLQTIAFQLQPRNTWLHRFAQYFADWLWGMMHRAKRAIAACASPLRRAMNRVYCAVMDRWLPLYSGACKASKYARLLPMVARAKCFPRRRRGLLGRRVLMLTISQIDVDPRINKAARTLVAAGYRTDILSLARHVTTSFTDPVDEPAYEGVTYVRVPRLECNQATFAMYQPEFVEAAARRQFDCVHANDLPTLLAAWVISRRHGVPLVYDAHEIWSENVYWDGREYREFSWKRRWALRLVEGFLLKNVDLFLSVSPSICTEYQRRHKLAQPPLLLPNVPELAMLRQCDPQAPSIRELCGLGQEHFITLYLGGVNPARNIERVVEAHRYLPENYVFVIRGPGIDYYGPQYVAMAESMGMHNRVFYLPAVDKDQLLDGAVGADCGVVMLRNLCRNFYWFYPNKFFEYMLAKIPVAVSGFPDVAAHIERERCGVTFDPDDPQSIAAALKRLGSDRAEARAMGLRGFEGVQRQYHWEAASRALVDAYQRMVSSPAGTELLVMTDDGRPAEGRETETARGQRAA
jgi:glycosyltransferase involved in cell wall biosynthesis